MILTIAIIWVSVAAVFVLGLCMAAARPVPQAAGLRQECEGLCGAEESSENEDPAQIRLLCGRSLNLLNGSLSPLEKLADAVQVGQRGGLTGNPKADAHDRTVSF